MNNSYKQKKLEEFRKNFVSCGYTNHEATGEIEQFIFSIIDETEKQAQSEMKEDLALILKQILPEERKIGDIDEAIKRDRLMERSLAEAQIENCGWNGCLSQIKQNIDNYLNKIK